MQVNSIDITPTPRVLRTLGEIPFRTWQCLAELIDNAIDALASQNIIQGRKKTISVSWSQESVATRERAVEITDNANGMTLDQLQNAVRAGYTGNDPIGNLGLFGMGFNIATARLGEETEVLSTQSGDSEWVGVRISFDALIKNKTFDAHVIRERKINITESGTKIRISRLKEGVLNDLHNRKDQIRKQLARIYSPLLANETIEILVCGRQLRKSCVCRWGDNRYVMHHNEKIPAFIPIDVNLGKALFDKERNRYLSADEEDGALQIQSQKGRFPSSVVYREKRLTGWLGIQRYADPDNFGIDFIRNGRKILLSDKSLFLFEDPYTSEKEIQYPKELGSTIGGRIIGELNVDYLIPTYQKNDFDRNDPSWIQTVQAVCGTGPFLPGSRKRYPQYKNEENLSPLCRLVNAYRRVDSGTKCLFTPNNLAKQFAKSFENNDPDYQDDTKWWKAAQEFDQNNGLSPQTTPVNSGMEPTDDPGRYITPMVIDADSETPEIIQTSPLTIATTLNPASSLEDLKKRSTSDLKLSGPYGFEHSSPLNIKAYRLTTGTIEIENRSVPAFFASEGMECTFVYNPFHPLITQYPFTPKMMLLTYISEKLKARDGLKDIVATYSAIAENTMTDEKIDAGILRERVAALFENLREALVLSLQGRAIEVVKCIHESKGETEETCQSLLNGESTELLKSFQAKEESGFDAIRVVPPKTLLRLVDRFPENIFDGKVFLAPYTAIHLDDENAVARMREDSKDRILSYLKDALRFYGWQNHGNLNNKDEITRTSLSVSVLTRELV